MSAISNFDYVIYHANCSDGISSAWVTSLVNDSATRIGCVAGKIPNVDIETFCDRRKPNNVFYLKNLYKNLNNYFI